MATVFFLGCRRIAYERLSDSAFRKDNSISQRYAAPAFKLLDVIKQKH